MKIKILSAAILGLALIGAMAQAGDDKAEIATLTKTYPLTTCVVSGEKLGEMGEPYDMIYKEKVNGKETDRLVRFCCRGCVAEFEKEPAKFVSKLNDAVAKKN